MQYTEEQQRAIDARGTDLLLSAAAGSGKTAVLVQRVLSLIEEGADAVSYTHLDVYKRQCLYRYALS